MTGIANNFQDNPRYQRYIQKIQAMRPDQRAILDTTLADETFADEAMRKQVRSLAIAADLANRKKSLDLKEQAIGLRTNLIRDRMDEDKKQGRLGNAIAMANVPLAGYLGYQNLQRQQEEAEETGRFRKSLMSKHGVK
jgi:hypothetical protein